MFTAKTLSFLRALKRNNDREWFRARTDDYERHVRAPMVRVLERLAADLPAFAPDLISDPKVSLFRIYRDTRFSADKSPLKTAIGARFPSRRFARGDGAGLYFEIAGGWVWIGGGMYMPSAADLHAIRDEIAATHPRLHRIVTAAAFTGAVGEMTGDRLSRLPRGYLKNHPAAPYLLFKQFIGGCEFDASLATSRRFYPELLRVFRAVNPLVQFLNRSLLARRASPPMLPDAAPRRDRRPAVSPPPAPAPMW
jgi:uncharacterized protein (TIGR02453 family)